MSHFNQRGITLTELLISMMLLATALVGLAASYPLAMQATTLGGFQTTATLLAPQAVQTVKSMPYHRLPLDLPGACPASPTGYPTFTRSITVTPASPTPTTTTITTQVIFQGTSGGLDTKVATILSQ